MAVHSSPILSKDALEDILDAFDSPVFMGTAAEIITARAATLSRGLARLLTSVNFAGSQLVLQQWCSKPRQNNFDPFPPTNWKDNVYVGPSLDISDADWGRHVKKIIKRLIDNYEAPPVGHAAAAAPALPDPAEAEKQATLAAQEKLRKELRRAAC